MKLMAKPGTAPAAKMPADPGSGRSATVRGAGALKGRLTIEEGIDLTKPIAAQVLKESRRRDDAPRTKR
jgi:hypothetical protein